MTGQLGYEPVAVASRSGFDESVHFGAVVACDGTGVAWSVGDPDVLIYPRSANKPIQADAMLRVGWDATPEQVALACGSHAGSPRHLEVVRSSLDDAGLDESALRNTPSLPLDPSEARAVLAAGGGDLAIQMNCSGKHAAMVATCAANGWDVERYLDIDHPLQRIITARVEDLAGPVSHVGVDGCGAPAHVVSLLDLARAFGRLAADRGLVWYAMTRHPDLVAGDGRDATALMRAVPELMAKDGAEGVFAAGLPDGRCAAVKISDGAGRAAGAVLAAALAEVGVDVDPAGFAAPVLGHGQPVGEVRLLVGGAA